MVGPEPYGLVALATILLAPFNIALESAGWFEALLRAPQVTSNEYASLFWTHIGLGVLALPIIIAGAPLLSSAFETPSLLTVTWLLASVPLAVGGAIVPKAKLARNLRFKAIAIVELVSVLIGYLSALLLAVRGSGVLSLVALQLCTSWFALGLVIFTARFFPPLRWRWSEIRGFVQVTSRLFAVSLLKLIEQLSLRALVAYLFGIVALGNYVFARRILEIVQKGMLGAVDRVGLAHMGRSGQSGIKLKSITRNLIAQGVLLTWPVFILLIAGGASVLQPLFADEWSAAFPLLTWIGLVGLSLPVQRGFRALLIGCGRYNWIVKVELIGLLLLAVLLGVAIHLEWGLVGIVQALAIRNAIVTVVNAVLAWHALNRHIGFETEQSVSP